MPVKMRGSLRELYRTKSDSIGQLVSREKQFVSPCRFRMHNKNRLDNDFA